MCDETPPVKPYMMRQQVRCRDNVESQYFTSPLKDMGIICSYCCSDDDVLSPEEVKKHQGLKGREPLPLCMPCIELKVAVPLKPGRATDFTEKGKQKNGGKMLPVADIGLTIVCCC